MKKVFKSILIVICFLVSISFLNVNTSKADSRIERSYTTSNAKDFFIIVRTIENGIHYISIYTTDGALILKDIEL